MKLLEFYLKTIKTWRSFKGISCASVFLIGQVFEGVRNFRYLGNNVKVKQSHYGLRVGQRVPGS